MNLEKLKKSQSFVDKSKKIIIKRPVESTWPREMRNVSAKKNTADFSRLERAFMQIVWMSGKKRKRKNYLWNLKFWKFWTHQVFVCSVHALPLRVQREPLTWRASEHDAMMDRQSRCWKKPKEIDEKLMKISDDEIVLVQIKLKSLIGSQHKIAALRIGSNIYSFTPQRMKI